MGDYFDDEDLINDYIEDFEEPPEQEIPDEVDTHTGASGNTNAAKRSSNLSGNLHPATRDEVEELKEVSEVNLAVLSGQKNAQLAEGETILEENSLIANNSRSNVQTLKSFIEGGKEKDLYSFKRYTGATAWREISNSNSVIDATARKRKRERALNVFKAKNGSKKNPKKFESAAQLIDFSRYSHFDFFQTKSYNKNQRYSFDVKNNPKEGKKSFIITLNNGEKIQISEKYEANTFSCNDLMTIPTFLLSKPMPDLLKQVEMIKKKTKIRTDLGQATDDENHEQKVEYGEKEFHNNNHKRNHQLWVDKYSPTMFSHLLSDDRTNREVLRCLREWDPYVFHRDPPARPEYIRLQMQKQEEEQSQKKTGNSKLESSVENVDDKRPPISSRVILLCGPPGVGKTTLAHIISYHVGYQPLEINASDDRTASVLCDRIKQAMESNSSLISQNQRPTCLILDEIDGANDKATMNAVINIIKADLPLKKSDVTRNNGQKQSKQSKSRVNNTYLRRPIIFIANHKYSPVLSPLLPYARVFDMSPPSEQRLVSRIKEILAKEGCFRQTSEQPLRSLVKISGGDIRSCLHTLQFAASGGRNNNRYIEEGKGVRTIDISKTLLSIMGDDNNETNHGCFKDERTDIVEAILTIFRKGKEKNKKSTYTPNESKDVGIIEQLFKVIEAFDNSSKIIDTIFTNLPRIPFLDHALDRSSTAHEWLSSADVLRSYESSVAQNNMVEHLRIQRLHIPASAIAVHLLCHIETNLGSSLIYSTREFNDVRYKLEANNHLLHRFKQNLPPNIRNSAGDNKAITVDFLPYLMWLISAGEGKFSLQRAVTSLEILNENERIAFWEHVKRLRAMGLTYVKIDGFDNNEDKYWGNHIRKLRLEPGVDQLVTFEDNEEREGKDINGMKRREIPSVLKELLAHEAALEAMRDRDNQSKSNESSGISTEENKKKDDEKLKPSDIGNRSKRPISQMTEKSEAKRAKTNFLGIGAMKARAARTARNAAIVGFDRTKKEKLSNTGSNIPLNKVIRFKYRKGFTQAVRTPCRLEDLL